MATGLSRNSDIIENLVEQNASHPGWKRNETDSTTLSGVVDELECETFAKEYEIESETDWDSEAPAQTNLKARVKNSSPRFSKTFTKGEESWQRHLQTFMLTFWIVVFSYYMLSLGEI